MIYIEYLRVTLLSCPPLSRNLLDLVIPKFRGRRSSKTRARRIHPVQFRNGHSNTLRPPMPVRRTRGDNRFVQVHAREKVLQIRVNVPHTWPRRPGGLAFSLNNTSPMSRPLCRWRWRKSTGFLQFHWWFLPQRPGVAVAITLGIDALALRNFACRRRMRRRASLPQLHGWLLPCAPGVTVAVRIARERPR